MPGDGRAQVPRTAIITGAASKSVFANPNDEAPAIDKIAVAAERWTQILHRCVQILRPSVRQVTVFLHHPCPPRSRS
jgi:hypothetical protein